MPFPYKLDKDKEERHKVRYVSVGHLDIMKRYLAHGAQTIQCVSVRLIFVVAKIKGFHIWVVDVKLVCLQSDKSLIRKIVITNPVPEFELSPHECIELPKSIYGLTDSGDE